MDESFDYPPVLDEVYFAHSQEANKKIELIKELYQLPVIPYTFKSADRDYYEYATTIINFVVVVFYTSRKQIFLFAHADENSSEYHIPASRIKSQYTFESTINSIATKMLFVKDLAEVEPIAVLDHTFVYSSGQSVEKHNMRGLAYIARVLDSKSVLDAENLEGGKFFHFNIVRQFLSNNQIRKYTNKQVLEIALERINTFFNLRVNYPDKEIETNKTQVHHYIVHNKFFKPALRIMKRYRTLNKKIFNVIGKPEKFLDASCGESDIIYRMLDRGTKLCVANDVSWSQISLLLPRLKSMDRFKVLFTNHNIVFLPFKDNYFDVAFCKNTLHHLNSPTEFRLGIENLLKIAKIVIIIEVQNPNTRFFSRIVRNYYQNYLKDAGEFFFNDEQFKKAITEITARRNDCSVDFDIFKSLHSNYLFAKIVKRHP